MGCGSSSRTVAHIGDSETKPLTGVTPAPLLRTQSGHSNPQDTRNSHAIEEEVATNAAAANHMMEVLVLADQAVPANQLMSRLRRSLEPDDLLVYEDRVQHWRAAFQKYADKEDGLTFKDIHTMFFEEGLGSRVEALVWFNKADKDQNKHVTWEEFNEAMSDSVNDKESIIREAAKCARRTVFLDEFSRYDVDGSGGVTLKEMRKIFREEGKGKFEALDIFKRLDKSGDGVISFEEYVRGMEELLKDREQLEELTKADEMMAYYFTIFKYFDSDHSGSITTVEMKHAFKSTGIEGYLEVFEQLADNEHVKVITASSFIKMMSQAPDAVVQKVAEVARKWSHLQGQEIHAPQGPSIKKPVAENTEEEANHKSTDQETQQVTDPEQPEPEVAAATRDLASTEAM